MRAHRLAMTALVAAILTPAALYAQNKNAAAQPAKPAPAMSVDDFMTPQEAEAIGITSMTPAQREAFERWLDRYTATVARVAKREPAAAPATRQAQERPAHHPNSYLRNGAKIAELLNGGDFVRLEDGSVWEIYASDRVATVNWKTGSLVIVRERNIAINSGGDIYDMLLMNGEAGTTATARFRGVGKPEEMEADSQ
ncbi:MAG TPA: hypothetical protein VJ672_01640 [Gemmatimonadaceae bacterium]|nr:hypothetical protein [Gemmatimonadaceae bacterium]